MTAVEYLVSKIASKIDDKYYSNQQDITEFIEQAKEMERKQIIYAFGVGCHHESKRLVGYQDIAEQYYNETYGSKGSDEAKNDSAKCGIIDNVDYWEKTLEYWKAEKEISNIGSNYYGLCCARIAIIEDFFKSIQLINTTSSQTEISDEEMWEKANEMGKKTNSCIVTQYFYYGAKWYREQLKQRQ